MSGKRNKSRKNRRKTRKPPRRDPSAAAKRTSASPGDDFDDGFLADWAGSRSGATAARGFHFQDAVGAWIAAQIAHGDIEGVLVPEGLDDMQLEAPSETAVQVKSRVLRRGPFRASDAAGHIIDAWLADDGRSTSSARVWVVLENGVKSQEQLNRADRVLSECLHPGSPLDQAIAAKVGDRFSPDQVKANLGRTVVLALRWEDLDRLTDEILSELASTPAAGRRVIARELRAEVADVTDNNAHPDPTHRRTLDRSSILRHIHQVTEQIHVANLEEALRAGVCSPFDRTVGMSAGDRFYEGESTQPGHVADGLVVVRPDLVSEVLAAVEDDTAVVLTGPSGVGKSAVLWTIPEALPGVAWFRVQRLRDADDANLLMRLARAHGASDKHPVGFLVDGAGTRSLSGWDHLRAAASAQPGIVQIATVRKEDLITLGGLLGTRTIDVSLDETAARVIYGGLQRRDATTAPHWREAFDESGGLTLEYTHLLTQGRRLGDVIGDQVQRRIVEGRDDELDLLALVSVADQWSISLDLERLSDATGTASHRQRLAVSALVDEHLLVEEDGILTGLHPVRSTAISTSIHRTPPPTLASTAATLLRAIDHDQLPRFVAAAVREEPSLLDVVFEVGRERVQSARRLAAFLQGLRIDDSAHAAREWVAILQAVGVPRSLHLPVAMFAIADLDFSSLGDLVREDVQEALVRIAEVRQADLRDRLAALVDPGLLSALVFGSTVEDARILIATLAGSSVALDVPAGTSELMTWLETARSEDVASVMAALRHQSDDVQQELIAKLGGEAGMLERLRAENPWLLALGVRDESEGPVGFARLLQVDDLGDARERCLELARVLLRLLPSIVATDIEVLLPGGRRLEIGGHVHGTSGLLRRYDHDETEQAWNQVRIGVVQTLVGTPDTARLSAASPIICELAGVVREAANRWVRAEPPKQRDLEVRQTIQRLYAEGEDLPPRLRTPELNLEAVGGSSPLSTNDSLASATTQVARLVVRIDEEDDFALLAAYARDHVLKPLREALEEPWHLIADGDRVLDVLGDLACDVKRIHDVLVARAFGGVDPSRITRIARRGAARFALSRCATDATNAIAQLTTDRATELAAAVNAAIPDHNTVVIVEEKDGFHEFALLVNGPALFEWAEIEERIVSLLKAHQQLTESFVVLPLRHGRRIENTGVRIMRDVLPVTDLSEWEGRLPEAHSTTLAPEVAEATTALQVLSGLADLPEAQREHAEVAGVAEAAANRLNDAIATLQQQTDEFIDHVLEELYILTDRVTAELENERPECTFAEAVAAGALGTPSDDWSLVIALWVCAVEWEIEPEGVRRFLGWT